MSRPRRICKRFRPHGLGPLALVLFLSLSPPAVAGDYDPNGSGTFVADPGETNNVTFSSVAGTETITDTGAVITVAPGFPLCTGDGTNTVTCPVDSTFGPSFDLGDENDSGTVGATPPPPPFSGDPVASFSGGAGVDTLTGNSERDSLTGGAGADVINAGDGGDFLSGGPDGDTVHGDGGDDSVAGGDFTNDPAGAGDLLFGDGGEDFLTDQDSPPGIADADVLNGGPGRDYVGSYFSRSASVTINLATGTGNGVAGENDTLTSIEDTAGGSGNDVITGSAASNDLEGDLGTDTILGGAGDDFIFGGGGNDPLLDGQGNRDFVSGEGGDDTVRGGDGEDTVRGSEGTDAVHGDGADDIVAGGGGPGDQLFGEDGDDDLMDEDDEGEIDADSLDGGLGTDQVLSYVRGDDDELPVPVTINLATGIGNGATGENDTLTSIENAVGSLGDDTIVGSSAANDLHGRGGTDTIDSGAGSDAVFGGGAADILTGGTERDELRGDGGADILNSADGGSDQVGCGADIDTVNGEPQDFVEADCEVLNGGAVVGSALGGAPGNQGPGGAQGPRGPAGTATCVVKKPKKSGKIKVKVTCSLASKAKREQAKLKRQGRTVARGTSEGSKVQLFGSERLRHGRYVLMIGAGHDRSRMRVRIR